MPLERSTSIIVLSYLLFGLFNFFQFGEFIVPVPYSELVVFLIVIISFIQNRKGLEKKHLFLLFYSIIGVIVHPFLSEIFLTPEQQNSLYDLLLFDILNIIKWILLTMFLASLTYNKEKHQLKLEWLIPTLMSFLCLFNFPLKYIAILFILIGLSAFYTLRKRTIVKDFLMEILIGIGIIYMINIFYWI